MSDRGPTPADDRSTGWETVADRFMAIRSDVGAELVSAWATRHLTPSASILDVGCGSGVPVARALVDAGFAVSGIDASPTLITAFRRNCPGMPVACEPAQDSRFFYRTFAAAVSIGLIFLLDANDQRQVLRKVAGALEPDGHFLFSAPSGRCEWRDALTGRRSTSLGVEAYAQCLYDCGLCLADRHVDKGGNHYFHAVRES